MQKTLVVRTAFANSGHGDYSPRCGAAAEAELMRSIVQSGWRVVAAKPLDGANEGCLQIVLEESSESLRAAG